MHLHAPEIDKGLVLQPRQREFGGIWAAALAGLTELDPEAPTHFIPSDHRLTQLDRIMLSTPWMDYIAVVYLCDGSLSSREDA
eukprot:7314678-Pyramimonas_sp.AAC.1